MSDTTELQVYFRTTNPKPLQELQGIFNNSWDAITVVHSETLNMYEVIIRELSLLECSRIFKEVNTHCKKNNRELIMTITYGVIHSAYMDQLKG